MQPGHRLCLCFFRGLNVFGRSMISMSEVQKRCIASFGRTGLPIRFLGTRGVSLLCDGQVSHAGLEESDLGFFLRITPSVVAVYRREQVTQRGTLDSTRRDGGWAAVSNYVGAVVGGLWTARSFGMIQ